MLLYGVSNSIHKHLPKATAKENSEGETIHHIAVSPGFYSFLVDFLFCYSKKTCMDQNMFQSWKRSVPQLGTVLEHMQERAIIAVGGTPYPRITPSLFLENYTIYSVKDPVDNDLLRSYAKIFCLEEKFPKASAMIRSTSYLLGIYAFQAFLKASIF